LSSTWAGVAEEVGVLQPHHLGAAEEGQRLQAMHTFEQIVPACSALSAVPSMMSLLKSHPASGREAAHEQARLL
jgi:hypothetical protein